MPNIDVARQGYQSFQRKDIPGVMNTIAEDCLWISPGDVKQIPWGGTYRGHKQIQQFFQKLDEAIEITEYDVLDMIERDDIVVVW